ncbi:MAG: hypothetical protein AAF063_05625 [Cyanobacteria bacterium J06643_5]
MKEVLELIEKRKQEFAKLPFFEFLQDKSIDPRQRLVWVPCIAPLVMTFGELNKYILRKEVLNPHNQLPNNKVQNLINQHTYEDDHHWIWFLEDLDKMGFNPLVNFTDVIKFLWSKETQAARYVAYELIISAFHKDPMLKLAALESVEATGNVGFTIFAKVGKELEEITYQKYSYFSKSHLNVEMGHLYGEMNNIEQFKYLKTIVLTPEQKMQAFEFVNKIFDSFTELLNQMMIYANQKFTGQPFIEKYSLSNELIYK